MFEMKKKWKSPPPPPPPYEGATVLMKFELIGNYEGHDMVTDSVPEVGKLNFIKGVCEAKVPVEMADDFPSRCPYGFWFKTIYKGEVIPAVNPITEPTSEPISEPGEDLLRYRELNEKVSISKADLNALVESGAIEVTKKMQGHVEHKYYSVKAVKAALEAKNEN